MNNPAVKTREDVITELNDAGFDERESRGIVQAVVDTTATLDLATHKDIDSLKGDIDSLKGDIDSLKGDIDSLEKTVDKIYLWIRWGFGILLAFIFFLSSRGG